MCGREHCVSSILFISLLFCRTLNFSPFASFSLCYPISRGYLFSVSLPPFLSPSLLTFICLPFFSFGSNENRIYFYVLFLQSVRPDIPESFFNMFTFKMNVLFLAVILDQYLALPLLLSLSLSMKSCSPQRLASEASEIVLLGFSVYFSPYT